MCGVFGLVVHEPVNQLLYDGLQMLQHRGQDAAGIATLEGSMFHMHKDTGMVRDVFRTRDMRNLVGNAGIAHVRYPTAGNAGSSAEAQPFYVNSPFGIVLAHNGNLTNTDELYQSVCDKHLRHVNTGSDSEVLLNVLAHELHCEIAASDGHRLEIDHIFNAVGELHSRVRGAYGVVALIAGYGLLAFRDPYGIRPLVLGKLYSRQCARQSKLAPCLFEYVYFARPDSVIDGVSVYQARVNMGVKLAEKVKRELDLSQIDVVMPIPDTSRPSAMELAAYLGKPYREGFIKNRYIGRTFIMPGQATRKKSVRQKLNPMDSEFKGKNILLVDDSIVRGTTSREIVEMAKASGAEKVFFASAAPEVRYPNVYGIDMPTREELIANGRTAAEVAAEISADGCVFQNLDELKAVIREMNPKIEAFDDSCFSGLYLTGDIDENYLQRLSASKSSGAAAFVQPGLIDHSVRVENGNEE